MRAEFDGRKWMARKSQITSFPDRKISEAFLDFAEPLLEALAQVQPTTRWSNLSGSLSLSGMQLSTRP